MNQLPREIVIDFLLPMLDIKSAMQFLQSTRSFYQDHRLKYVYDQSYRMMEEMHAVIAFLEAYPDYPFRDSYRHRCLIILLRSYYIDLSSRTKFTLREEFYLPRLLHFIEYARQIPSRDVLVLEAHQPAYIFIREWLTRFRLPTVGLLVDRNSSSALHYVGR